MKRLSRDKYTTVLDPTLPPAITIASGEELLVETWDAYKGVWGADQEPPEVGAATGPIAVEGRIQGMRCVSISSRSLPLRRRCTMSGLRGFLGETFTERRPTVMPIRDGHLVFPGGINVPIRPSIGLIATTPTAIQITASDSGPYGGDLDMQELVVGSTLWLPVFVPGGKLVLGDCHAVVGDGAVGGTGAECSAEVTLRLTVEQDRHLPGPRALTPQYFAVLVSGEEVGPTMRQAVRQMVDFWCRSGAWSPMRRIVC